jgi:hypothetical protein
MRLFLDVNIEIKVRMNVQPTFTEKDPVRDSSKFDTRFRFFEAGTSETLAEVHCEDVGTLCIGRVWSLA